MTYKIVPDTFEDAQEEVLELMHRIAECRIEDDKCFCFKSRIEFILKLIRSQKISYGRENYRKENK